MANDLTKRADPTAPKQAEDAASRLKSDRSKDALGRMFGEDGEKIVPGKSARHLRACQPCAQRRLGPRRPNARCSRRPAAAWR
jgi:hypothetical protein